MVVLLGEMRLIPEAGLGARNSFDGCLNWNSARIGVQSSTGLVRASAIVAACGLELLAMEDKISGEERKFRPANGGLIYFADGVV